MSADSCAKVEARKLVIVDDEDDLVTLFTKMIHKWGYTLEMVTSDGGELVAAIGEGKVRPDVVLMDYRLKSIDGIEAAKKIITLDPSIKIVIFSADDSPRGEALRSGFTFLPKPCSLAELKRAIGPS
jgi:two-component system, chemotaxis family, chemotaxis protein CheY